MGKGKKMKKYKAPDAKYLVVVDPWGTPGNAYFVNNVAAWVELMIKDDYPDEDVKTIFTQGTHNNIIVELSDSVDVLPYLGAHHHERFLKPPYDLTDGVSYIYEYDYEKNNDPARRSWTAKYPTEYDLNIFPIKQPYPLPLPAPAPPYNVDYAKRPRVILSELPPATSEPLPNTVLGPGDVQSPTHVPKQQEEDSKLDLHHHKQDPYEEEDAAECLLRTGASPISDPMKREYEKHNAGFLRVKEEERITHHLPPPSREQNGVTVDNAVDDFLDSILPVKKEELITHHIPLSNREQENVMIFVADSADALLNPIPTVKEEQPTISPLRHPAAKTEPSSSQVDNYQPSADLLAAFACLPQHMVNQAPSSPSSESMTPTPLVKAEPRDDAFLGDLQRGRSTTLATGAGDLTPLVVRVKPEPRDDYELPPSRPIPRTLDPRTSQKERSITFATEAGELEQSIVGVKPEPRDDYTIPPTHLVPRTRDLRLVNRVNGPSSRSIPRILDPRTSHKEHSTTFGTETEEPEQAIAGVKPEPRDEHIIPPAYSVPRPRDPRLMNRSVVNRSPKRVLDDEHDRGNTKRIKSEG